MSQRLYGQWCYNDFFTNRDGPFSLGGGSFMASVGAICFGSNSFLSEGWLKLPSIWERLCSILQIKKGSNCRTSFPSQLLDDTSVIVLNINDDHVPPILSLSWLSWQVVIVVNGSQCDPHDEVCISWQREKKFANHTNLHVKKAWKCQSTIHVFDCITIKTQCEPKKVFSQTTRTFSQIRNLNLRETPKWIQLNNI